MKYGKYLMIIWGVIIIIELLVIAYLIGRTDGWVIGFNENIATLRGK
uniref:Uncharacterized protein n=1 Tax=viral metagenome TaxID=1070528 RepID=A0A6M3JFZ2_9ZZZZ